MAWSPEIPRVMKRAFAAPLRSDLRCRFGRHAPVSDFSRWGNAPSGQGFHVGMCKRCGIEMTKKPGDKWRPIRSSDRK